MEDIKDFKKIHYYNHNGEMSAEEVKKRQSYGNKRHNREVTKRSNLDC